MEIKKIISCDFDGTLCDSNYPQCGELIQKVINQLLKEQEKGTIIILNTMREGKPLQDAIEWCFKYGIFFDAINDNCHWTKEFFKSNPRKIFATEYWDNRSVNILDIIMREKIDKQEINTVINKKILTKK